MAAPRMAPLLILLASAALVGGALLFQYVGGLQPCELCLYQRWPYYAAIVLSLAALAAGRRPATLGLLVACALLFLAGAGVAFYHVGIEQRMAGAHGRRRLMVHMPGMTDPGAWHQERRI